MGTIKELRSRGWISVKEAAKENRVTQGWIHREEMRPFVPGEVFVEFLYGPELEGSECRSPGDRARRYVNAAVIARVASKRRAETKARGCDFNGRQTDRPEEWGEVVTFPRHACPGCGKSVAYREREGLTRLYSHKDSETGLDCDSGGKWGWFKPDRVPGETYSAWKRRLDMHRREMVLLVWSIETGHTHELRNLSKDAQRDLGAMLIQSRCGVELTSQKPIAPQGQPSGMTECMCVRSRRDEHTYALVTGARE